MAHVVGTLEGTHKQFKIKYADKITRGFGASGILQSRFPFREKEKTGEKYTAPILTRRVAGGTYAAAGVGRVDFNDMVASTIEKAELQGSQYFNWNGITWEAGFSSDSEGKLSFTDEFRLMSVDVWDTGRFRLEMLMLWGQNPLGTIGQVDGAPAANTVTIKAAELAPGILYQLEGATLEVWDVTLATKRAGGNFFVTAVDPELGKITMTDTTTIVDTDVIFFAGERTTVGPAFVTAAGLSVWSTPGVSIAGLNPATRAAWQPTTVSAGNDRISFDVILDASARVQNRGHRGKVCCLLPVVSWNDAMNDLSATVRRRDDARKYTLGAESISFYTGLGEVEVVAHPYMKNGYGFIFPVMTENWMDMSEDEIDDKDPIRRIGAQELCYVGPDGKHGPAHAQHYIQNLQGSNIFYVQVYSHQALFVPKRQRLVKVTGIVPGA
jgi:hypothetical protein